MQEKSRSLNIYISDKRLPAWLRRIIAGTGLIVLPVGIGIAADSSAMQWMGFVSTILFIFGLAKAEERDHTFETIEEAKTFLDTLPRE